MIFKRVDEKLKLIDRQVNSGNVDFRNNFYSVQHLVSRESFDVQVMAIYLSMVY